jgi:hypothetical protein
LAPNEVGRFEIQLRIKSLLITSQGFGVFGAAFTTTIDPDSLDRTGNNTAQLGVSVLIRAPEFVNSTPPSPATVGTPYSYTFTARGDPAPTFTVDTGTLPDGLTLTSGGVLSGTPTRAGTFNFAIRAANGVRFDAVTPTHTIVVNPAQPGP